MRFSVPRSPSPSPVRKQGRYRRSSSYGIFTDSDGGTDADSDLESEYSVSSSLDSDAASDSGSSSSSRFVNSRRITRPSGRTPAEQKHVDDTISAIRLRTRHNDPYEEWEKDIRREAFRTARKVHTAVQKDHKAQLLTTHDVDIDQLASLHGKQVKEVEAQRNLLLLQERKEQEEMIKKWELAGQRTHERIEKVIDFEEGKVKAKLEVERRRKEEEQRRKEEAQQRALEEEQRKRDEEQKKRVEAERKRKEAEEAAEAEEKRKQDEQQRAEEDRLAQAKNDALKMTTASEDWGFYRKHLLSLKQQPMQIVKVAGSDLRKEFMAARRKLTVKVGQLTKDESNVDQVARDILAITDRGPQHSGDALYYALCSALSKAILLQAETEATADKATARPIALLAMRMVQEMRDFGQIFLAKLVQRAGGWVFPAALPSQDVDGTSFTQETYAKASGYRKGDGPNGLETSAEYNRRVEGIMRVYFHMVFMAPNTQAPRLFSTPNYWTYFARMLGQPKLYKEGLAPLLLTTAIDAGGLEPVKIWGRQWIKMLQLLYNGAGVSPQSTGTLLGGDSPEGTAARGKLKIVIEEVMGKIPR